MKRPFYLGDEVSAGGYRLASAAVHCPAPGEAAAALAAALDQASLVLVSAPVAQTIDPHNCRPRWRACRRWCWWCPAATAAHPRPIWQRGCACNSGWKHEAGTAAAGLLDLVQADCDRRCAQLRGQAQQQAQALRAQALADARQRVRQAFADERERTRQQPGRSAGAAGHAAPAARAAAHQRPAATGLAAIA